MGKGSIPDALEDERKQIALLERTINKNIKEINDFTEAISMAKQEIVKLEKTVHNLKYKAKVVSLISYKNYQRQIKDKKKTIKQIEEKIVQIQRSNKYLDSNRQRALDKYLYSREKIDAS